MSAARRPTQLLDLPDELLSEVLQHVSVADKQQNVQLCCMRLRRLLMQPIARRTWGSVRVRVQQAEPVTATQLGALLQWLTSRQAGIRTVELLVEDSDEAAPAHGARMVLHALAGALAPFVSLEQPPPLLILHPQTIDFGSLSASTVTALGLALHAAYFKCTDFKVQHWVALCSLQRLQQATFQLEQIMPQHVQQPQSIVQAFQLTRLRDLRFFKTNVDVAPFMAHAAALTALEKLSFLGCSLGTLPAGVLNLPRLAFLAVVRSDLTHLPPLAPLTRLEELSLSDNNALVDLRPALADMQQLRRLRLRGLTPVNENMVNALPRLTNLQLLDISKRTWSPANSVVLGLLVQMTHSRKCTLIT